MAGPRARSRLGTAPRKVDEAVVAPGAPAAPAAPHARRRGRGARCPSDAEEGTAGPDPPAGARPTPARPPSVVVARERRPAPSVVARLDVYESRREVRGPAAPPRPKIGAGASPRPVLAAPPPTPPPPPLGTPSGGSPAPAVGPNPGPSAWVGAMD